MTVVDEYAFVAPRASTPLPVLVIAPPRIWLLMVAEPLATVITEVASVWDKKRRKGYRIAFQHVGGLTTGLPKKGQGGHGHGSCDIDCVGRAGKESVAVVNPGLQRAARAADAQFAMPGPQVSRRRRRRPSRAAGKL